MIGAMLSSIHHSALITSAMTFADKLAAAKVRGLFAATVSQPDAAIGLARAALLVGAEEEPRLCDVGRCLARLDELGEQARARVERAGGSAVEALNRYLFDEQPFAGNESDYYYPPPSTHPPVLQRRH